MSDAVLKDWAGQLSGLSRPAIEYAAFHWIERQGKNESAKRPTPGHIRDLAQAYDAQQRRTSRDHVDPMVKWAAKCWFDGNRETNTPPRTVIGAFAKPEIARELAKMGADPLELRERGFPLSVQDVERMTGRTLRPRAPVAEPVGEVKTFGGAA